MRAEVTAPRLIPSDIYRDPSEPSGGGGGSGERWLIRGAADQGGCARPGESARPGSNKPRPRGFGAGRFGRHFSRRLSHYSIAETSASHDTPDLTQVVDGVTSWLCEPGDLLLSQPAPQGLIVDFDLSCRLA